MIRKLQSKRALLRRERRGSEVLEAALVFPLLLALAFGTVEFGYYFYVEHNLECAAREGARAACVGSLTTTAQRADAAEEAVDHVMAASGYQTSDYTIDLDDSDNTYVQVHVKMHWKDVNEGLRPLRMISLKNDLVVGTATLRIEK